MRAARRSHVACLGLATLALLSPAFPPSRAAADEAEELAAKSLAAAKALAASALPTPAEMGPGWKRAWEVPMRADPAAGPAPEKFGGEDAWWNAYMAATFPVGLPKEYMKKVAEVFAQPAGGLSERDGLLMAIEKASESSTPAIEKLLQTADVMKRIGSATGPKPLFEEARLTHEARAARYAALSVQGLKDALVEAGTRIEERTQMEYFRCNNWEAFATTKNARDVAKKKIWVGVVSVTLAILRPDHTTAVKNLEKSEAPAVAKRISDGYEAVQALVLPGQMEQAEKELKSLEADRARLQGPAPEGSTLEDIEQRMGELRDVKERIPEVQAKKAALAEPIRVTVVPRDFGDNSYVVRVVAPAFSDAGKASLCTGWLRNGRALVEVRMGGNFPESEMNKEMDHFLQELDAKTAIYRD